MATLVPEISFRKSSIFNLSKSLSNDRLKWLRGLKKAQEQEESRRSLDETAQLDEEIRNQPKSTKL
jgi:hypothetical protein